jgi:hypothetical protein
MRKILLSTLFIASLIISLPAQNFTILPNTFYKTGEVLTYNLRYGFIVGGSVVLELSESPSANKNLNYIRGTIRTVGIADKIFKVKDIYESYFDKETGMPVLAIQNISEGKSYKYFNEVIYNRQNNTVRSTKSGEHKVPDSIMDVMSAFYYVRRLDFSKLKEGDIINVPAYFQDKIYPLNFRFKGRESISTKWGKIRCVKLSPLVEAGRVFKNKDDMFIWYSDDDARVLAQISLEMVVGSVIVELTGYTGLKNTPAFKK